MDIKDVEGLALLARIKLAEGEKQDLLKDMQGILDYVKVIESVDVKDTKQENATHNVWREDSIDDRNDKSSSIKLIKDQFPDFQDGFLKVKKIL